MRAEKRYGPYEVSGAGAEAVAHAVVRTLAGAEDEYLGALDEMYATMQETVQEVRRVLPITG
jgi:hypothetical protein